MSAAFTWHDLPTLVQRVESLLPDTLYSVDRLPMVRIRDKRSGEVIGLIWPRRNPNDEHAPCLVFEEAVLEIRHAVAYQNARRGAQP